MRVPTAMAFWDVFIGKERVMARHVKRVSTKRSQNADRWSSLVALGQMGTEESVAALLRRFRFRVDPSITDQEEKDLAFRGIIGTGDAAIPPVRQFLHDSESIAWPVKMLQQLVTPEALVDDLLAVLEDMGTDYERDPQRKIDVLMHLEERNDPRVAEAVGRFLEDVNETARFHAIATLLAQEQAETHKDKLIDTVVAEESVRVRVKILDAFIAQGWELGERADEVMPNLPPGYALDKGAIRKRK